MCRLCAFGWLLLSNFHIIEMVFSSRREFLHIVFSFFSNFILNLLTAKMLLTFYWIKVSFFKVFIIKIIKSVVRLNFCNFIFNTDEPRFWPEVYLKFRCHFMKLHLGEAVSVEQPQTALKWIMEKISNKVELGGGNLCTFLIIYITMKTSSCPYVKY